jgi:hypothetical protein
MKKVVYSILVLIIIFLINIWLYYYSENYSFFLKKIKYWDLIIDKESLTITDDYTAKNQTCNCDCNCDNIKPMCYNSWVLSKESENEKIDKEITNDLPETNSWNIITNSWQIDEFFNFFDKNTLKIKQYDEYYKIFDITDEYPTEYITYNNENFEVYLFVNWKFDDIYNMFELLSGDKTITNKFYLNRLDNFGEKSFFINMVNDDWKVRLIIDNWKILFWLYTKKSYYNTIKQILEKL